MRSLLFPGAPLVDAVIDVNLVVAVGAPHEPPDELRPAKPGAPGDEDALPPPEGIGRPGCLRV